MNAIDSFLNKITMYRLVLFYLVGLVLVATGASMIGLLHYSPVAIVFSSVLAVAVSWVANETFAYFFNAHPSVESAFITGLILALIMTPALPTSFAGVAAIVAASIIAMASKYVLALRSAHIFNPAAIAVVITGLVMGAYASWWVGNSTLLPFVFVGGLLITRKIQRFDMVLSFMAVALVMIALTVSGTSLLITLQQTFIDSAFFFFAFVMLTEPATAPPTRGLRVAYGAAVGLLYSPAIHLGAFFSSPEIALSVGNLLAYIASPKTRAMLTLKAVEKTGDSIEEFVFTTDHHFKFEPGQYLEWTLPHGASDDRGNRRYFTIASSPLDREIRLGVKFYEPSSTYKRALSAMKPGDKMSASQLGGDFTLPKDDSRKLVFIAGGIGITPFASMVRHMLDTKNTRSAVLLYANRKSDDIAYRPLFERAREEIGMRTIYSVSDKSSVPAPHTHIGSIDAQLIKTEIPDYADRTYFISGPRSMVVSFEAQLAALGIPRTRIKTDFFPGFA